MASETIAPALVGGLEAARFFAGFPFDPLGTAERCYRKFGPFTILTSPIRWRKKEPKKPVIAGAIGAAFNREVLSDPATWRTVSIGPGGPAHSAARRVAVGLISMHGDTHSYYRQLLLPPMTRKNIDAQSKLITSIAETELARWPLNETIDLFAYARSLLQIFAIALLFGDDRERGVPIAKLIHKLFSYNCSWRVALCPLDIPGTPYHNMLRAGEQLQSHILDWVNTRRGALDKKDLLSIVTNNPTDKGVAPTDEEIIGQVPTLLGAAFETCQNNLIWTLVLLCQHPKIASDLLAELNGRLNGAAPTLELIHDLPLLDGVVNESLRILPPIPQQFRSAAQDTTLANYPVVRRTKVMLSPFLTNRNPDLYPEPDRFKPERWATINPSPYEFSIFSAGPRTCPGFWFGTSVIKMAVASILTRFRIALAPGARINYKITLTLTPEGEIPAMLHPQDGAFAASPIHGSICDLVRFPSAM